MFKPRMGLLVLAALTLLGLFSAGNVASAQQKKPNILVIWGDDVGWFNISAYNHGMMGYKTPNIDRLAREGACLQIGMASRAVLPDCAAFITGQSPIRTGLLKIGMPGTREGLQKEDPTLAELLKPMGYVTGQFGKNHLGDLDEFLPTNHGFDEFFGNLYHLNAEEEPENPDYPKSPEFAKRFGPARRDPLLRRWKDPRHRPAHQEAYGNHRRGSDRPRDRLHGACQEVGQTVLPVVQHHAHAHLDSSQREFQWQDRTGCVCRRHG